MGTYTANKNLYMPTVGEQGWGDLMNTNLSTIDNFLKPITVSGRTYTFNGNQAGGSISATSITNSGTLTNTGKITANGGIGTTSLTTSGTITSTGQITANGGIVGTLTGNVIGNVTGSVVGTMAFKLTTDANQSVNGRPLTMRTDTASGTYYNVFTDFLPGAVSGTEFVTLTVSGQRNSNSASSSHYGKITVDVDDTYTVTAQGYKDRVTKSIQIPIDSRKLVVTTVLNVGNVSLSISPAVYISV